MRHLRFPHHPSVLSLIASPRIPPVLSPSKHCPSCSPSKEEQSFDRFRTDGERPAAC